MSIPNAFVKNVDAGNFPQEVLRRSREVPVVVDFWAEWCQPCRILGPILEKLFAEANGAFDLVKVDVDANQQLAAEYRVQGIPMVVAFRDGKIADTFTGALPEPAIRQWIEGILPTELDLMVDQARSARLSGDDLAAEHILRQALQQSPDHTEAGTSLASMLIDRGETDEALIVLGRLVPDSDVDRLQSAARLKASSGKDISELERALAEDPSNEDARIDLAKALATKGEYEPALDHLLTVVRLKGPKKEDARIAILDIFGVLGGDHPLTQTYRRQLATALF
ncbi:MAG TPA: thioredoxin [Acidimicrobiia bacterium]|nr:thioredoxin [Acidimicrobiia bacterium]